MQLARPGVRPETFRLRRVRAFAARSWRGDPRRFGRRPERHLPKVHLPPSWAADVRLFATAFVGGFLFVSILLA
jgi:hypothetical protein